MKLAPQPFVASRQGLGAIIATLFFTGVFVLVSPQSLRHSRSASAQPGEPQNLNNPTDEREPASVPHHHLPFGAESSTSDLSPAAVKAKTGVEATRVRSAIFFVDTITQHNSSFTLRMNLFPDAMLTAEFQAPSVLGTNSGLYVGTIAGDPDGQFRLNIEGERISGTIRAFHKSYQLIPTSGASHLIAELKSK